VYQTDKPEKVTGLDGKKQPAKKKRPPTESNVVPLNPKVSAENPKPTEQEPNSEEKKPRAYSRTFVDGPHTTIRNTATFVTTILNYLEAFASRITDDGAESLNPSQRRNIAEAIIRLAKALGFRFEVITFDDGGFSMATPPPGGP
jgi:hypothetical protein